MAGAHQVKKAFINQNTMKTETTNADTLFMKQAIQLAKKGIYTTRPNPAVGCVIVKPNNTNDPKNQWQVIGMGYHFKAGEPHAEINAMQDAKAKGHDVAGATVYVTLEPCSHTGKTPPCADALVKAKVARVVIAIKDPHSKVAGKGIAKLKQAGIAVTIGVCADEASAINRGFLKVMSGGLPYVRLKIASSLDGRTAMQSGESKWITGSEARQDVQHWRAISGVIITGSDTVLADDPQLNVRCDFADATLADIPQPIRVLLDRRGRVDMNFKLMQDNQTTLVFGHGDATETLAYDNLTQVLTQLKDNHAVYDVLIEAGGTLAASFVDADLVDEIILYQAPCFLGASARPMLNFDITALADKASFRIVEHMMVGDDLRLRLVKP